MHLGKNIFERESEKRRPGLRRNQGFCGRSSPFLVSKGSRRKKEARAKGFKRFKV